MDEFIRALKTLEQHNNTSDEYLQMGKLYEPIILDERNYHPIALHTEYNSNAIIECTFIDGGNTILFSSAAFSIGYIRVIAIHHTKVKQKEEFFIIIKSQEEKFLVNTYPKTPFDNLQFKQSTEIQNAEAIIPIIRRYAELEFATKQYNKERGAIILDGTLEARYEHEELFLKKLLETKQACALAKTCSLTTNHGNSIARRLLKEGIWAYYPIVKNNNTKHPVDIIFIKLHQKSNHVFRFEIQQESTIDKTALFATLAVQSTDPIFLGYPYGLIVADMYARISDDEKRILQTKIMTKLGSSWNEFSLQLTSMNAHEILDKIRF